MVAARFQRGRQSLEQALATVVDGRPLAMHRLDRDDLTAIDQADRLVPKANAEDRHLRPEAADDLERDAGVLWPRGSGADDDAVERPALDLCDGDLVVADDLDLGAQLAEVLVEVVGERVVVVEQQDAQPGTGLRCGGSGHRWASVP